MVTVTMLAALLLTVFLVYTPGLSGPQLLDDESTLSKAQVSDMSTAELTQMALSGSHGFAASRALPNLTFALTQTWSGPEPTARLKQQNLLLHLANGLLVFWFVWLLACQPSPRAHRSTSATGASQQLPWPSATAFALGVMAIWLLHPLQVSTVLYISQRYVLMAAFFMLAALIAYVKGRSLMRARPVAGGLLAVVGAGGFGLLAMLSKEIAALMPLLIAAVEFSVMPRAASLRGGQARALVLMVLVVVPLIALASYFGPQLDEMLGWQPNRGFSGAERLMTEARVLALYLELYVAPIPGKMSLFHDSFPITHEMDARTWALVLSYGALLSLALVLRRRARWISLGIFWFFACHLLESTVFPLELVFEHRNYLAIVGPTLVVVGSGALLLQRFSVQGLAFPVLMALVFLLGLNTAIRSADWGDTDRLLASEYRRDPDSPRVLTELINRASAVGSPEQATKFLNRMLALDLPEPVAEFGAMQAECRQDAVSAVFYERAADKLANGIISPTVISNLTNLVQRQILGTCPAIATAQLVDLAKLAYANPRRGSDRETCRAAELLVYLSVEEGNLARAEVWLGRAVDQCAMSNPLFTRQLLSSVLAYGKTVGKAEATQSLVRSIAFDEERRARLDWVYRRVGGFGLDKSTP